MANAYPTALNNYTGAETLFAAGHWSAHNAYEAKIGTGASTPVNNTVLRGNGTGTSAWAAVNLSTDVTGSLPVGSLSGTVTVPNGGTGAATLTGLVKGNGTSAMTTVTAPAGTVVGTSDTQTLTNKAITKRVVNAADAVSITPNADTTDIVKQTNTQAGGTLTINAPTGTPTDGSTLILRIKSTNAQTYSFNGIYRAAASVPLPVTHAGSSKTDYVGFLYNSTDTKYDCVGVIQAI